jgi:YD repeat-containing protein
VTLPWRLLLVLALALPLAGQGTLQLWHLGASGLEAGPGDGPMPVGSLQKPFVAKAWAAAHAGAASPRLRCGAADRCWLPAGHGELGLAQALTVSCNTYFLALAGGTPPDLLEATLTAEGFPVQGLTPEAAIGLPGAGAPLAIRPSRLLMAYRRLVQEPWAAGEPIRQEVLAGLRQAALTGTAAGLGRRGYWAKTGTVAASGEPPHTQGLVLALDDAGWGILARLTPGTGAAAAAALAGPLARLRPWSAPTVRRPRPNRSVREDALPDGLVTLRLFDLVRPRRVLVRNLGSAPAPLGDGHLGPGARLELKPGDQVGPALLEVAAPGQGLVRRLEGTLLCGPGLRLTARITRREYAGGILEGELPRQSPLRPALGAAVLRFLDQPPRHPDADVCDSTHCAWYVGRGPRLAWPEPGRARILPPEPGPWGFTEAAWASVEEAARQPGPCLWTSHCGGSPLSPHALWGRGDTRTEPCPRHGPGQTRPWARRWPAAEVARALGPGVASLDVGSDQGRWVLRVTDAQGTRQLTYDDAHRRLAQRLGWGALPSPADHLEAVPGGWVARGVGLGHRVGLCLGE